MLYSSQALRARQGYTGRFAPSPSGPLHDGSLVAAMASFLDARAHQGRWLLRIEDIDTPRAVAGADRLIMGQLQALGMHWDGEPVWQSRRHALYQSVFDALNAQGCVYGCGCTRQEIGQRAYPGTCRNGVRPGRPVRAWRWRVPEGMVHFHDRWLGPQQQNVANTVGDFIVKRADGLWAYQFVVVIDDWKQEITDIVRGADLLDSTARQRLLAGRLGAPCPDVMHVPLVLDEHGHKLSKQNHAPALDGSDPLRTLDRAWRRLGFESLPGAENIEAFWKAALPQWAARFNI
ncbi:MAG TPA: tRNA glutamyl-Q(34) synthetase GluQRS [Eoetvoesiella sp.]|uniref:tRNA glutamyl-Q(34) synthetase GluQRS n=1 Tax=Eoetvoesiella sp. TaxID=1966355 RepID=UPI002B745424|nr:tRNA glutamyl-Q(34) synthetase GluQRS [Eoetvoesiella sp.]HWK60197.1 tRNA glutamyl-Q(34) synthetase GluQRS [Eoetvoesiella sp.]